MTLPSPYYYNWLVVVPHLPFRWLPGRLRRLQEDTGRNYRCHTSEKLSSQLIYLWSAPTTVPMNGTSLTFTWGQEIITVSWPLARLCFTAPLLTVQLGSGRPGPWDTVNCRSLVLRDYGDHGACAKTVQDYRINKTISTQYPASVNFGKVQNT